VTKKTDDVIKKEKSMLDDFLYQKPPKTMESYSSFDFQMQESIAFPNGPARYLEW
jgi:hypothetical protein